MNTLETELSGWGRFPVHRCRLARPERYRELGPLGTSTLARGQGRSYGDAALNPAGMTLLTERLNRLLAFDPVSGRLRAEAGVTLDELLPVIVPQGWFLPVTPGTRFVSLGGCVAADVHGKNHHADGSFGAHVHSLDMTLADGRHTRVTPDDDLFRATLGGMGLTGLIGEVELQLQPIETSRLVVEHRPAGNLNLAFKLMEPGAWEDRHAVAWIDTLARGPQLGRSVLMRAHPATRDELPGRQRTAPLALPTPRMRSLPFDLPGGLLNNVSLRLLNALYYRAAGGKGRFLSELLPFFYPLDALAHWNRLYGRRGFLQFQCVLPTQTAYAGTLALLEQLAAHGDASFLAVLKRLGPKPSAGLLSFPCEGYTLALDLPLRPGLPERMQRLHATVLRHGGRVYLAKDATLSAADFRAMYPDYPAWLAIKRRVDPGNQFRSALGERLRIGDAA